MYIKEMEAEMSQYFLLPAFAVISYIGIRYTGGKKPCSLIKTTFTWRTEIKWKPIAIFTWRHSECNNAALRGSLMSKRNMSHILFPEIKS